MSILYIWINPRDKELIKVGITSGSFGGRYYIQKTHFPEGMRIWKEWNCNDALQLENDIKSNFSRYRYKSTRFGKYTEFYCRSALGVLVKYINRRCAEINTQQPTEKKKDSCKFSFEIAGVKINDRLFCKLFDGRYIPSIKVVDINNPKFKYGKNEYKPAQLVRHLCKINNSKCLDSFNAFDRYYKRVDGYSLKKICCPKNKVSK